MKPILPLLSLLGLALGRLSAAAALDPAEFQKLHAQLQPPAEDAWQTLPWHLSVLEGRAEAAQKQKPVYMLVRSGHPLGCVWNNGIADRASAFKDEEVLANLRERFIPVAIDQHIHRRLKNEEGALFAAVLKQAGRGLGGRSQGVYIFDPAGTLLAFSNTADADQVKQLMAKALGTYRPGTISKEFAKSSPGLVADSPPDGTVIALVTSKVLGGYEKVEGRQAEIHAASLGQDHLWIRADEAAQLAKGQVPKSLTQRIVRYHLVDNTRGEPPFWRTDEIRSATLALKGGRLSGHVALSTADGQRGYTADLLGSVATEGGRLTKFDLVASGQFHGEGPYTRGAPPGNYPFAVAVRLIAPTCATDLVVPGAARGNSAGYLQ